jgi:hypothetical protein
LTTTSKQNRHLSSQRYHLPSWCSSKVVQVSLTLSIIRGIAPGNKPCTKTSQADIHIISSFDRHHPHQLLSTYSPIPIAGPRMTDTDSLRPRTLLSHARQPRPTSAYHLRGCLFHLLLPFNFNFHIHFHSHFRFHFRSREEEC